MKSIKQQYIDLKEGRMSQHNFMRSVRMSMPQYITNVTSFNDTVKILKNKGILNEATINSPEDVKEQWFDEFQNAIENMDLSPEAKAKAIKALDHVDVIDLYGMFQPGPGANAFIGDIDDILARAGDEEESEDEDAELEDMIARAEDELSPEMYKNQDFPGGLSEDEDDEEEAPEDYVDPDMFDAYGMDASEGLNEKSYNVSKDAIPVSSLSKGDVLSGSGLEIISISAGAKTPSGKVEVVVKDPKTGKETTKIWNKATKVVVKKDLNEAKKKKEKKELNPNQIHPQELRMGIKVELEHTDDLDKAKKIALDHLAENPFYYTALKLAGVESPSAPKYKAPVAFKKEVAVAVDLVDKINAMKPVKGVEKIKASSNKAHKETNKVVKGVEELTHNAKTVRGLQKFAATGGKMKAIKLKEDYESFLSQKQGEEAEAKKIKQATNANGVEFIIGDTAVAPDGKEIKITGFTTGSDGKMKAIYSAGMFADVYNLDDLKKKPSFRPGVDLGKSFNKFKSMLEEIVREVINETFDGRDNLIDPIAAEEENN